LGGGTDTHMHSGRRGAGGDPRQHSSNASNRHTALCQRALPMGAGKTGDSVADC
jgi:hypothetical protein